VRQPAAALQSGWWRAKIYKDAKIGKLSVTCDGCLFCEALSLVLNGFFAITVLMVWRVRLPILFILVLLVKSSNPHPSITLSAANPSKEESRFSHRIHLSLSEVTCLTCHGRASESTKVSDNNLPVPEDCLACHKDQESPQFADQQKVLSSPRPAKQLLFSHKFHLTLGNVAPAIVAAIDSNQYLGPTEGLRKSLDTDNACEACHRGLRVADELHPGTYPPMADCLVCHATIEAPFSCGFCHPDGTQLKPASHTSDFMDRHSGQIASLDRSTCKVCHGVKFRCKGCH
jgi:hypothetical protein